MKTFISIVFCMSLFACVDTGDDPGCELPHEEDCAAQDAGVPAAAHIPRVQVVPAGPCRTNGVPCKGGVAP